MAAEQARMKSTLTRREFAASVAAPYINLPRRDSAWRAGLARVRITPDRSLWQAGYAARTRASEGTLHEIYVRALALDDGRNSPGVLVAADLLGFPRPSADRIASEAGSRYGIPRANLVLNASHTHGAPVVGDTLRIAYHATPQQWSEIYDYTRWMEGQVVDCIGKAVRDLRPARVQFGRSRAAFAANRRPQPGGPVDHDVPILRIDDLSGRSRGIVFGYACHNTTLGGDEYRFHGDYAGFAQSYLEARNPGAVALYVAGCGGDANPSPRGRVQDAIDHGESLGNAVQRAIDGLSDPLPRALRTAYHTETLKFAVPPTTEQFQERLKDQNIYVQRHARMMLDLIERRGRIPREYSYPIQAWRIGDSVTFIPMAGEVVVDYSLRFKKELGHEKTWVAGYSNDVFAYIPSLRILREGGYEGEGAMLYYGQPGKFTESVEETIVRGVHRLIKQVS